ncbi:MAG TPA: PH domain-containing protein [Chitinophagaceae bacterium]|nr:PH domain-containing protein [Chitinophagaceae bacterium]
MRTHLKKDEKLLLITRQHWMTLIVPFLACIIIITLIFYFVDPSIALLISLALLLVPGYLYLEWKNNLWAVTNMRVIDESGFFTRYSKESPLEKINNVEYTQGVLGRMFGYGDVEIQTAAELGDSKYTMIHDPKVLKDTITHAQEEYKGTQLKNQAQQLSEAIKLSMPSSAQNNISVSDEIEKLFSLMQKGAITQEEYIRQKNKLLGS